MRVSLNDGRFVMARYDPRQLTDKQVRLARAIERAGLASFSQATRAILARDDARVAEWIAQLDSRESSNKRE